MQLRRTAGKLVVVCGLPGAGRTTHARALAAAGAVRFAPDQWLAALALDLYDEQRRARSEGLQWTLVQEQALFDVTLVLDQRAVGED